MTYAGCQCFALALLAILSGCAPKASKPVVNEDPLQKSLTSVSSSSAVTKTSTSTVPRSRLPGTDNGLEIRKWTVADQPDRFLTTIAKNMHGSAVDPDTQARLERNGLRLVRVPIDRLDQLLADLGGASLDLNEWHGQAVEWRSLQQRPIGSAPRAIAIDGNVLRFEGGRMAFNLRAWTVQMEDGPCVHMEMLPRFEYERLSESRGLLSNQPDAKFEAYPSMALDVQLRPGFAYVLFGEPPQAQWPENTPSEEMPAPSAPPPPKRNVGPMDVTADEGAAPVTLGEFMLMGDRQPPMRGLMVFIPRVAPELFAPDLVPVSPEVEPPVVADKIMDKSNASGNRRSGGVSQVSKKKGK